jgi:energy-coupling factor transporter ATP-binding protein EcfA2
MQIKVLKFSALRGVAHHVSPFSDMFGSDAGFHEMQEAFLAKINIFIGKNGAGKSTILDILRALGTPKYFQTLKRGNLQSQAFHGLDITFQGSNSKFVPSPGVLALHVEFERSDPPVLALRIFDRSDHSEKPIGGAFPNILQNGIDKAGLKAIAQQLAKLNLSVFHWQGPEQARFNRAFVTALKSISSELAGVSQDPNSIRMGGGKNLDVRLATEPNVVQAIPYDFLPSGWKAAAGLLAWVASRKSGSLVLIEEPETHLHPSFQRMVALRLAELVSTKKLQLFVSTHSSVFLNSKIWEGKNIAATNAIAMFHVDGKGVHSVYGEVARAPDDLLDELGVRAGDLMQSNFVVWVEGPSDRIYLKYWLECWCSYNDKKLPIENVDYSFVLYGGSVLSHYHAGSEDSVDKAISMLKINRNSFMLMDRDHDFSFETGVPVGVSKKSAKYRVLESLGENVWITRGYTIESYLPSFYTKEKYLIKKAGGGLSIGKKLTKVELAYRYKKDTEGKNFLKLFKRTLPNPSEDIARLFKAIFLANQL